MSGEPPQRFTGGAAGGRRFVGFATAHHPGTKASIPSRFETILSDNREANGFGSRTYRFGISENDLPGPGTYAKVSPGVSTRKSDSNYSANGTSAFASAKRAGFADSPVCSTPGPGSYTPGYSRSNPHVGGTVSFSSPVSRRPAVNHSTATPGPGEYNVALAERRSACSAFSSKAPRGQPAPVGSSTYLSGAQTSTFGKDVRTSASMVSRTQRFDSGRTRSAPPAAHLPPLMASISGYSVRTPAPSVVLEVGSAAAASSGAICEQPPSVPKPSPMFADTMLDRFGRPTVRYTIAQPNDIGPGHYEQDTKVRKMLVSSSWALNAVPRDGLQERYQPPGPAYYKADMPARKVSHRSNTTNTWAF